MKPQTGFDIFKMDSATLGVWRKGGWRGNTRCVGIGGDGMGGVLTRCWMCRDGAVPLRCCEGAVTGRRARERREDGGKEVGQKEVERR